MPLLVVFFSKKSKILEKEMLLPASNTIKITSSPETLSESYELLVEIILSTSASINMALCYSNFTVITVSRKNTVIS